MTTSHISSIVTLFFVQELTAIFIFKEWFKAFSQGVLLRKQEHNIRHTVVEVKITARKQILTSVKFHFQISEIRCLLQFID